MLQDGMLNSILEKLQPEQIVKFLDVMMKKDRQKEELKKLTDLLLQTALTQHLVQYGTRLIDSSTGTVKFSNVQAFVNSNSNKYGTDDSISKALSEQLPSLSLMSIETKLVSQYSDMSYEHEDVVVLLDWLDKCFQDKEIRMSFLKDLSQLFFCTSDSYIRRVWSGPPESSLSTMVSLILYVFGMDCFIIGSNVSENKKFLDRVPPYRLGIVTDASSFQPMLFNNHLIYVTNETDKTSLHHHPNQKVFIFKSTWTIDPLYKPSPTKHLANPKFHLQLPQLAKAMKWILYNISYKYHYI